MTTGKMALAIHGGCGVMAKDDLGEEQWRERRDALAQALQAGWAILKSGGSAIDAAEAAVIVMEDSPHFNAGYGAALNRAEEHELDASIMDGATMAAGGVACVQQVRNPVKAARAVMARGEAVLLAGPPADRFAEHEGLEMVAQDYFTTERRRNALARIKAREAMGTPDSASEADKHGTVGAAALDGAGNLAAATSTGGFNNKPAGRVGDSPIIGAGTYARNGVCAVSGTGKGEEFIRHAVAHDVASRMTYLGETLSAAAETIILESLASKHVGAGLVAVGADGAIALPYNTGGMYRGWVTGDGVLHIATHEQVYQSPAE